MPDLILTITLLVWTPLIPLRLIIQGGIGLWRKMSDLSYFLFFLFWAGIDLAIMAGRGGLLGYRFETFPMATVFGITIILLALLLACWTSRTLGLITLFMRPQVSPKKVSAKLIVTGPYRWIRHPFYLMEWLLLLGLSLVTQSWIVAGFLLIAMIVDPIVTVFEERELCERFGKDYTSYQRRVPRLFPTFSKGAF